MQRHLFYKPYWNYLVADIIALILSVVVVLWLFPLSTQIPFQKYDVFAIVFSAVWLLTSYLTHRYVTVKYMKMGRDVRRLLGAAVLSFGVMYGYMWLLAKENFSIWVLLTIWLVMLVISLVCLVVKHAYRYALNEEDKPLEAPKRSEQSVLKQPKFYAEDEKEALRDSILEFATPAAIAFLEKHITLYSSNTFTLRSTEVYNIQKLRNYRYDTLVNFMPLNQIRGVNKLFAAVNDKLPDNGLWVCCYEPQSVTKRNLLMRYPKIISWLYRCKKNYRPTSWWFNCNSK